MSVIFEQRSDYSTLKFWLKFSRFLAYGPIEKRKLLYPIVLALLYSAIAGVSFYARFGIYELFNISQKILDTLQGLAELIYVETVILSGVFKARDWLQLIDHVTKFEDRHRLGDLVVDSNATRTRARVFVYHLIYVTVHLYDTVVNWSLIKYTLAFIVFRITTYYLMVSALLVHFLCVWLANRYRYLNAVLLLLKESRPNGKKLTEVRRMYVQLYRIVERIDTVFGSQFLLLSVCTVLEILNAVNYALIPGNYDIIDERNTSINAMYLVFYLGCYVEIVMSCESVRRATRVIHKTCLVSQDRAAQWADLRSEYRDVALLVQGLDPEFSAAGFWTIDQPLLATMFSSVITYIIVIIQFNISLK